MQRKSFVHQVKDNKLSNRDGVQKALEDIEKEMGCEGDHYCKIRGSLNVVEGDRGRLEGYAVSNGSHRRFGAAQCLHLWCQRVYMV